MTTLTRRRNATSRTWTWKDIVFPIIAAVLGLLLLVGAFPQFIVPWFPHTAIHDPKVMVPVLHLWHYAQAGMHTVLLMVVPLVSLVLRPRQRVLIMQFLVTSTLILGLMIFPWRPSDSLVLLVALAVLTLLYPDIRSLTELPRLRDTNRPILGLTLICSPFLLYESIRLASWQILGVGGEHATAGHWIAAATIPLALVVGGILAASKRPGRRELGVLTGLGLTYLGAASFALPHSDGTWGTTGGIAALVAGAAFLVLTVHQARR